MPLFVLAERNHLSLSAGFFKNKYVIGSIFISVGILLTFMYLPFCQKYLKIVPIEWENWLLVIVATIAVFLAEEARKEEN